MGVIDDLKSSIRQVILMESKLDGLTDAVEKLSTQNFDQEKRLIRIETMIEMAQSQQQLPSK